MPHPHRAAERPLRDPLVRAYPPLADYPLEPASDELTRADGAFGESYDLRQGHKGRALLLGWLGRGIVMILRGIATCLPQ